MIAEHFIRQGSPRYQVLPLCGVSRSSYYYRGYSGCRGRKPSTQTMSVTGVLFSNDYVLERIEWLLGQEFVDYGYEKTAAWLRQEGMIINKKKVYRLMAEQKWLKRHIQRNRYGKRIAKELLPNPQEPFSCLQTDIKYI